MLTWHLHESKVTQCGVRCTCCAQTSVCEDVLCGSDVQLGQSPNGYSLMITYYNAHTTLLTSIMNCIYRMADQMQITQCLVCTCVIICDLGSPV